MPNASIVLDGVEQTVTRRVVQGVVYDLVSAMGLPYNTKLTYPGSSDPEDLPVVAAEKERNKLYDPNIQILLEVTEEDTEAGVPTMIQGAHENPDLFRDDSLGVRVTPQYSQTEVTVALRMRFQDRNLAEKQRADMRRYASLFRDGLMHELNYHYLIPAPVMVILKDIHRCRETQAGYGENFVTWIKEHFSDQISLSSNQNLTHLAVVKNEIQANVLGTYDFEIAAEKAEPNSTKTTHILSFTYKFRYDKPLALYMSYPILIHNVPIGLAYYDRDVPYELGARLLQPSRTRHLLDQFTNNTATTGFRNGAPIPAFMDWMPKTTPSGTQGLLRVMVRVSPDAPRRLFNLTQLGQLQFHDYLIEYMKAEYANLTRHRHSVVFVALYENDKMLDGDAIEVDAELNISTTFDMDLRKQYHVFVALLCNWSLLPPAVIERIRANGDTCRKLLNGVDYTLNKRGLLPTISASGAVSLAALREAIRHIRCEHHPHHPTATYQNFLVGQYLIAVK